MSHLNEYAAGNELALLLAFIRKRADAIVPPENKFLRPLEVTRDAGEAIEIPLSALVELRGELNAGGPPHVALDV